MNTNKQLLPATILLALCLAIVQPVRADLITWNSGALGSAIPDADPAGWSDTYTISGSAIDSISSIKVYLNIAGGYNGDYYAFLQHGSDTCVLLNRPGVTTSDSFGYGDSGLNIAFQDGALNGDVHFYQLVSDYSTKITSGGIFQPDGRYVDPLAVSELTPRDHQLSLFTSDNPNGDWTLFVADLSSGEVGTVQSWGMEITGTTSAVPEPGQWAMMGMGAIVGLGVYLRRRGANGAPKP